jgi:hypothetical protein
MFLDRSTSPRHGISEPRGSGQRVFHRLDETKVKNSRKSLEWSGVTSPVVSSLLLVVMKADWKNYVDDADKPVVAEMRK